MHIAVEGCSHGELDIIYNAIMKLEEVHNIKIDLLLCCGDFQAVRNEQDLKCMAVPMKYMKMQDFHKYYSGEKKAPVLTIFIGGNHEASNYLQELPYGGWVAPNIYYLGYAGVVKVGDLRIGGLSGIYKGPDYLKGHFEKPPYSNDSIRSVYHVRNLEVFRLKQLSGSMDIFMSHDWPRGIYHYGNVKQLLQHKSHFEAEIKNNSLGSRAAEDLIKKLKPNFWFSGHLHVKFSALYKHEDEPKITKFLALDKCLPRREFLQILEVPNTKFPVKLEHDAEWLTILRLTNHLLSTDKNITYMPGPGGNNRYQFVPTQEEIEETISDFNGDLTIHESDFIQTAKCYTMKSPLRMHMVQMPPPLSNPQTEKLCRKLSIHNPIDVLLGNSQNTNVDLMRKPFNKSEMNITLNTSELTHNPDELLLNDEEDLSSGDIVFEMNNDLSSNDLLKLVSPIRGPQRTNRTSYNSPLSSSPRVSEDSSDKRKLCLPLPSQSARTSSTCSSSPTSVCPNEDTASTHSSESPNSSPNHRESSSLKRSSDGEEEETDVGAVAFKEISITSPSACGTSAKRFKRRNESIYSSTEDESGR